MNCTYKKEVWYTLGFSLLLLMCGHTGLIFAAFPSLRDIMIMGFPSQYCIPVGMGWIGLMVVVVIQAKLTNQLDDEIEAVNASLKTKGE